MALIILLVALIQYIGPRHFPSQQLYRIANLYAGVPVAFACALLAGLMFRRKPIVVGVVFAFTAHTLVAITTPPILGRLHFWIALSLSVVVAPAGALLATMLMTRFGKCEPLAPFRAGITGLVVIVATWLLTFFVTRSL